MDEEDEEARLREEGGLVRTGRLFGGLMNDIKRKQPFYLSDFKVINYQRTLFVTGMSILIQFIGWFCCSMCCILFVHLLLMPDPNHHVWRFAGRRHRESYCCNWVSHVRISGWSLLRIVLWTALDYYGIYWANTCFWNDCLWLLQVWLFFIQGY